MPGGASGPAVGGQPYTGDGGIALRVNGAPAGSPRSNVNFQSTPGLSWSGADDVPNDRVNLQPSLRAEVLLGTPLTGVDLVPGGALELAVSGLTVQQAKVTRVVAVCEQLVGAGTDPEVEAGTDDPGNPPNNDVALAQALAFTAVGQELELALESPRPLITQAGPFDVLRLRQTVAATGYTNFVVGFQVYGLVITP